MSKIAEAIAAVYKARGQEDAALHSINFAENEHGAGSKEAEAVLKQQQSVIEAVSKAEAELVGTKPASLLEALKKADARLAGEMISKEAQEAIREDLTREYKSQPDPVVDICKRILNIRAELDASPIEIADSPEQLEAFDDAIMLERQLQITPPTTPLGVAMLASVMWKIDGPGFLSGTDGWAEQLERPEYALLARLRQGAFRVAGKEAYEVLGLRP